jgi:hypothetical protein
VLPVLLQKEEKEVLAVALSKAQTTAQKVAAAMAAALGLGAPARHPNTSLPATCATTAFRTDASDASLHDELAADAAVVASGCCFCVGL